MSTKAYTGPWSPDAFAGKELIGMDLSNRCLVGADFSNAVCKDCDFSDSDLSNARFNGADLYRCDFSRAVLYAVEFDNANLTRAKFPGAFTYGWLLNESANVTYASLLDFGLEERRRSVEFDSNRPEYVKDVKFGDQVLSTSQLCRQSYQVGKYRFTFQDLDPQEAALQRSQIFNRMKRLYRENHNGEAALHCLYYERYYLTRSFYKFSPLTGGHFRDQLIKTVARTAIAYLSEFVSGYGVRPLRVLRNLVALCILFFTLTFVITTSSSQSGVVYTGITVTASERESPSDLGKSGQDFARVAQYSLLSMVTPDPQRFSSYGMMVPMSLLFFVLAATLLALLFASVFLRLLSD
jgi:hypothetical protein